MAGTISRAVQFLHQKPCRGGNKMDFCVINKIKSASAQFLYGLTLSVKRSAAIPFVQRDNRRRPPIQYKRQVRADHGSTIPSRVHRPVTFASWIACGVLTIENFRRFFNILASPLPQRVSPISIKFQKRIYRVHRCRLAWCLAQCSPRASPRR